MLAHATTRPCTEPNPRRPTTAFSILEPETGQLVRGFESGPLRCRCALLLGFRRFPHTVLAACCAADRARAARRRSGMARPRLAPRATRLRARTTGSSHEQFTRGATRTVGELARSDDNAWARDLLVGLGLAGGRASYGARDDLVLHLGTCLVQPTHEPLGALHQLTSFLE